MPVSMRRNFISHDSRTRSTADSSRSTRVPERFATATTWSISRLVPSSTSRPGSASPAVVGTEHVELSARTSVTAAPWDRAVVAREEPKLAVSRTTPLITATARLRGEHRTRLGFRVVVHLNRLGVPDLRTCHRPAHDKSPHPDPHGSRTRNSRPTPGASFAAPVRR